MKTAFTAVVLREANGYREILLLAASAFPRRKQAPCARARVGARPLDAAPVAV
jgi:hypothetical protein